MSDVRGGNVPKLEVPSQPSNEIPAEQKFHIFKYEDDLK
jgi:hypothetical protein